MKSKMARREERCHSVDIIKGICILFVIITHYEWSDPERLTYLFPFWIDMAVPVFMIISGFLYSRSFQKKGINSIESAYSFGVVLRKIVRYSVPFIIAFAVEVVAYVLLGNNEYSIMQMCVAFLCGGFGPGSYYYPLMMQFVFFFPLVFFVVRKYEYRGVIICGFANVLYEILKFAYGMNEGYYRLSLLRYTLLIAYGCFLGFDSYKRHRRTSIVCFLVGTVYIIVFMYMGIVPPFTNYWTGTSVWACLFIIPLAKPLIINKLHNCIIEAIGRASYDIFLVQMVYFNGVEKVYGIIDNIWIRLLVNLVICVSVGLVFYYIETPITKKISEKLNKIIKQYTATHSIQKN